MYGVVSKNMSFAKQALYLKQTGITRKEHMWFLICAWQSIRQLKKEKVVDAPTDRTHPKSTL